MRFSIPLARRFFGKLIHDILPAALASLLGGFLITHFELNRPPEPVTVKVTPASPEMMQLLRDEHGLIVDLVKTEVAKEKKASEQNLSERERLSADVEEAVPHLAAEAPHIAAEAPPMSATIAPPPAPPRPATVAALPAPRPAALHTKAPVVATSSLPVPAVAPVRLNASLANENVPQPARNDDSLLAKTIGIKDRVVAVTQQAVSVMSAIPSWFGSIGDRIGGEDANPRPPARLVSEF